MKKIIYDDGREQVVGTAGNWSEVREICFERGLAINPVGSEGPDAFYVSQPQRRSRKFWPPRNTVAAE